MILSGVAILLPIFMGILGSFLHRSFKKGFLILQGLMLFLGGYLYSLKEPMEVVFGHKEAMFGVSLSMNSLSGAFLMVFSFFMVAICLYEWKEMAEDPKKLLFLFLLEGIFVAFIWSDDLFNLFVLIEAITLISSILIAIEKRAIAMQASVFYLLFNSFSIFFFLIGVIWLYYYTGHLSIPLVKEGIQGMDKEMLKVPFAFMMTSLGIKSAMFPLYTWLPRAHSVARSSVSALLSGILVKTGLYAFIKIYVLFSLSQGTQLFLWIGGITAVIGALFAIKETDMKRILAFHTVSQLGWMVAGFSMGGKGAVGGEVFFLNHALFKGGLFLCVGILAHSFGTKNIKEVKGLWNWDKKFCILFSVFLLSIMGFPLLGGYVGKTLVLKGTEGFIRWIFELGAFLTILSFWKFFSLFTGKEEVKREKPDRGKYFSLFLLASLLLVTGLFFNFHYTGFSFFPDVSSFLKWVGMFLAGYGVYRFLVKPNQIKLSKLKYEMGFETALLSAFGYFALIVIWL